MMNFHHFFVFSNVNRYWQSLENAAIATLASYGVIGERDPAGTGVWVKGKKVAAVGLAASRCVCFREMD
jgi:lipoyl(octanoyl) transferase